MRGMLRGLPGSVLRKVCFPPKADVRLNASERRRRRFRSKANVSGGAGVSRALQPLKPLSGDVPPGVEDARRDKYQGVEHERIRKCPALANPQRLPDEHGRD